MPLDPFSGFDPNFSMVPPQQQPGQQRQHFISPEEAAELSVSPDRQKQLEDQIALIMQLKKKPMTYTTPTGAALGGAGQVLGDVTDQLRLNSIQGQQGKLNDRIQDLSGKYNQEAMARQEEQPPRDPENDLINRAVMKLLMSGKAGF
jgi:hypothetical protein